MRNRRRIFDPTLPITMRKTQKRKERMKVCGTTHDVGSCSSYWYVRIAHISADYAIFSALVFGDHFWNCPGIRGEEGVNTHP